MKRIYITLSKVFRKSGIEETQQTLRYAGMDVDARIWLGQMLMIAILISFMMVFLTQYGSPLLFSGLAVVAPLIYVIGASSIPYFIAKDRASAVEEILPNALQLMSSNILSGMTPFQALKISSRKEFGALKEGLDVATTKALGTESFTQALMSMTRDIQLPALDRSLKLFSRSIESGGHLATMLQETARDINDNLILRNELLSQTRSYSVLILLTIIIGSPILFNVSIHFTERLNAMQETFSDSANSQAYVGLILENGFDPEFLVNMSALVVAFTSTIASLLIGVITAGTERYGIRYAFIIVPLSLIVFYGIRISVVAMS